MYMKKTYIMLLIILSLICITGFALSEQWSEVKPNVIYLEKHQYRSRGQERTQSSSPVMDGWFCYDQAPGEWGEWINNGSTYIESAMDREVYTEDTYETQRVLTGYRYKHYRYVNASGSVMYSYSSGYAESMGFAGYWETKETSAAGRLEKYKVYDGVQSYGVARNFWFDETGIFTETTVSSTVYKYRTRPRIYYFYKWLDWSDWQDESIEATEEIDVDTRTLYAVDNSKIISGIHLETVTEIPMLTSTGCQIQYQGNGHDAEWSSSDISVASVDASGYLSAHNAGTASISVATENGDTYCFTVIVKNWPGLSLPRQLSQIENEAFSGGSFEFVDLASGTVSHAGDKAFSNNSTLRLVRADNQVSFGSQVFDGSDNVVIACKEEGAITDYAQSEGIPYYVIGPEQQYVKASSISFSEESITLQQYQYYNLPYEVFPHNATEKSVIWSSSDPSVVSIPFPGRLRAEEEGTAIITATSRIDHTVKAECLVTVVPVLVNSVYLYPDECSLYYGESVTLTATAYPYEAKNRALYWTTSNPLVATVTQNGVVTGVGEGTATISAMSIDGSQKAASCSVTVQLENLVDDSMYTSVYVNNITETNATLRAKLSLPHNPSQVGYYFGTSLSDLVLCATEDSSNMPLNNQIIWYNLNVWGKTLKPGTKYYYQFFIVYDGVIYRSEYRSFTTAGTAGVLVDESKFTTVYTDNISETNAVIHTKVSLPHNPTTVGFFFGTSAENLTLSASEDASNMPLNNQIIWYDLNKWGKTLSPCTTYYYQFYIVYDDFTYKTNVHSFQTAGTVADDNPVVYRLLCDTNYNYSIEAVMGKDYANSLSVLEFFATRPFFGRFFADDYNKMAWFPSDAKMRDGSGLTRAYNNFDKCITAVHYTDISKARVFDLIKSVFRDSDDNDVNIFFYGGHGTSTGNLLLKTEETISPSNLAAAFRGIKGHNVIIVSACYSGNFASYLDNYPGGNFYVLTSSSINEESWSYDYNGRDCSADVYYILRGIGWDESSNSAMNYMAADWNGDNKVTFSELYRYMANWVVADGFANRHTQSPQKSPSSNGDLILYER